MYKRVTDYSNPHNEIDIFNIDSLEKKGSEQFILSDQMPVDVRGLPTAYYRQLPDIVHVVIGEKPITAEAYYRQLGFTLPLYQDKKDALFMDAKLPAGWTKESCPLDVSFRTIHIKDAAGRIRITVWYKAMPYDRAAYAVAMV